MRDRKHARRQAPPNVLVLLECDEQGWRVVDHPTTDPVLILGAMLNFGWESWPSRPPLPPC